MDDFLVGPQIEESQEDQDFDLLGETSETSAPEEIEIDLDFFLDTPE